MANYPTEFPAGEIGRIISALRDGFQKADVQQLLKSAWLIQGWAFGTLVGDVDGPPLMRAALDDGDSVERIEELIGLADADYAPPVTGLTDLAIRLLIEKLLDVLAELIEGWLSDE